MKRNFTTPPINAADKAANTTPNRVPPTLATGKTASSPYTPVPRKDPLTAAPRTAAKGDDEVMSTPAKKS